MPTKIFQNWCLICQIIGIPNTMSLWICNMGPQFCQSRFLVLWRWPAPYFTRILKEKHHFYLKFTSCKSQSYVCNLLITCFTQTPGSFCRNFCGSTSVPPKGHRVVGSDLWIWQFLINYLHFTWIFPQFFSAENICRSLPSWHKKNSRNKWTKLRIPNGRVFLCFSVHKFSKRP